MKKRYSAVNTWDSRRSDLDAKHTTLESLLAAELAARPGATYDAAENILTDASERLSSDTFRLLDCCGSYELRRVRAL